jgi:adenylylsulfate kinase
MRVPETPNPGYRLPETICNPEIPSMIVWFTGLPCSGKTTIATALTQYLIQGGNPAEILDGDMIRRELWSELGFSRIDREENIHRLGFLAELLARHSVISIVAAVSPYRAARDRDLVRMQSPGTFIEVYINTPLSVCEQRDVKGMYREARSGTRPHFTGIDDPYEPPLNPNVECFTERESVDECVIKILKGMRARLNIAACVAI